jgi:aspartyl-tRNA(Asn)/glutamyl-tRNA(Gln) amidotransferase subunit B
VEIEVNGMTRSIALNRIHMEEDAGKNNHELDPEYSLVDLNRAGVPLLEIVTEPDLHSADEAYAYLTEIRRLVRYLDVCDGNMEEGSLRCDANISIRLKGETKLNTRVEVKNMNSIRNVKRAIENELKRQIELVEAGGKVEQETRSFVPADGSSFVLRSKEFAHDYRYFPEPDLPPVVVSDEMIDVARNAMPALPKQLYQQFTETYKLSPYDAHVLIDEQDIAGYFIELTKETDHYKAAVNWVMGEVKSYLNEHHLPVAEFPVSPKQLAAIIALADHNQVSSSGAKTIFQALIQAPQKEVSVLAKELNLLQSSDSDELSAWAEQVLSQHPDKVLEYKKGKKGILGMFMGELMKLSKGKADPKLSNKILEELLKK